MKESDSPPSPPRKRLGIRQQRELWKPYREAVLGFRNYWYPICFERDLVGEEPKALQILGEKILLRRVDRKVRAIEDRCAHRRVTISHRFRKGVDAAIECYTKDTVTCWYHGFTYSFVTGKLVANVSWPTCPQIGKVRIKTYPVREVNGLVYVWIGDGEPGPFEHDVIPGFLDDDLVVEGRVQVVDANWRWGVENGFDSTHIYMHRNSILFEGSKTIIPLGLVPQDLTGEKANLVLGPGPIGMREDLAEAYEPMWAAEVGDPQTGQAHIEVDMNRGEGYMPIAPKLSVWLPCMAAVQPWPIPGIDVFEVYVPIDEKSHYYFQLLGKNCASEEEAEAFREQARTKWRHYVQDGFNCDDIVAREGLQEAYADGNGWLEETLTAQDLCIMEWRNLASKYHRGIQRRPGAG